MLTFEEWWEINWFETYGWRGKDLVENGWNAAIKNMEALKPLTVEGEKPDQCPEQKREG